MDRCCADRAPGFRPSVGLVLPWSNRGWLCCRQSPEFAPVRLEETALVGCQGEKFGDGAGRSQAKDTVPERLDSTPASATVAG